MRTPIAILCFVTTLFAGAAYADAAGWTTPKRGSQERRAIMDAMRPTVERKLNAPIEFVVNELRVIGDWAFAQVTPQRPGGRPINLRNTPLKAEADYMDGVRTEMFLRRRNGRWQVIDHAIGATDVWFEPYCQKAPRALLADFCPS